MKKIELERALKKAQQELLALKDKPDYKESISWLKTCKNGLIWHLGTVVCAGLAIFGVIDYQTAMGIGAGVGFLAYKVKNMWENFN